MYPEFQAQARVDFAQVLSACALYGPIEEAIKLVEDDILCALDFPPYQA